MPMLFSYVNHSDPLTSLLALLLLLCCKLIWYVFITSWLIGPLVVLCLCVVIGRFIWLARRDEALRKKVEQEHFDKTNQERLKREHAAQKTEAIAKSHYEQEQLKWEAKQRRLWFEQRRPRMR